MSILKIRVGDGSGANDFIDIPAIVGPTGMPGKDGVDGTPGTDGQPGADGKSAYQIWLDAGNTGTEADFLASLVGPQGPEGKPGEDGKTPDLSGVVKFVNNIGPDDNGNVEIDIEREGFKVYRVKDGVKSTSSMGTTVTYNLTDECKNTIKTMIFNFLNGEKNGMLIIDTKGVNKTPDSFCFIINESSISGNYIYFQSLISPSDYKADYVGGDYSCRISIYYYQLYVVLNTNRDDINTYTCKGLESILNAVPTTQYLQQTSYTITGVHTYNKLPQSSVEPTDDKDLVNKAYVDNLVGDIESLLSEV